MKKIDISVVVPVFNEQNSLKELVKSINNSLPDFSYELIFVDDGSSDDSFSQLKKLKTQYQFPFKIIKFRTNQGKSAALSVGFSYCQGEKIITLDADLQDDPAEILKLLKKLDEGYDLVVGWRKERQDPKSKIRSSHLFNTVVNKIGHLSLHDINCGLKVIKKEVAQEIDLYGELHRFIPLLAANRGFKVTELEVVHHQRKYGVSKYGHERVVHAFFDLISTIFLTSFRYRPLQIFGLTGFISILIGFVIMIYLSYLRFLGQTIGRRPLLFLGILFFLFGVQIFSTGLLAELINSHQASKNRYPISDIIL